MSSDHTTIVNPVDLGDRLLPYENTWVALDRDHEVLASDERLPSLLDKLTPEQEAANPTFLQVLPHDVSFISAAA